jgi:hypothetical protein
MPIVIDDQTSIVQARLAKRRRMNWRARGLTVIGLYSGIVGILALLFFFSEELIQGRSILVWQIPAIVLVSAIGFSAAGYKARRAAQVAHQ